MAGLKRIDHIGVVVRDLAAARELLEVQLGLQPYREIENEDLRAVFLRCGDAGIELIEMKDPVRGRERIGGPAAARVEHIAIEVESLAQTRASLEDIGIALTGPPQTFGSYTSVWTKAETSGDVMYQFTEKQGGG